MTYRKEKVHHDTFVIYEVRPFLLQVEQVITSWDHEPCHLQHSLSVRYL